MNSSECRYLIQRRFDGDLEPEEEQALDDYIDDSESCAKFEHQLDQMIQGAEELSLPEDFSPPNPEALAKQIQQQLPQQKAGFFSAISNLFGGSKKKDGKTSTKKEPNTQFPHRARKSKKKKTKDMVEEDQAVSDRLKSLNKTSQQDDLIDSRDAQSTTSSLGQKLGFETGGLTQQENSQLTLAESIKRKIAESQGISTDEGEMSPEEATEPAVMPDETDQQEKWSTPTPLPNQQTSQPVADIGLTPEAPPSPQPNPTNHPGSAIGLAPPGSPEEAKAQEASAQANADGWNTQHPKGTKPGADDPEWGPPPVYGTWDEPGQAAGQQTQSPQGGSWDEKSSTASGAWGSQEQPAQTESAGASWGSPQDTKQETTSWGQPGQAQQTESPTQEASGGWGAASTAQSGQTSDWGGQAGSVDKNTSGSWATPQTQKAEESSSSGAWGAAKEADATGGGWSQGGQSGSAWGETPSTANTKDPNTASGSWASPTAAVQNTASAEAPAGQDSAWSTQSSDESAGWAQPAAPSGGAWPASGEAKQEQSGWGGAAAGGQNQSGWGTTPQPSDNTSQSQATPATQTENSGAWGTPGAQAGSWGGNSAQTAQTAQPAQPAAAESGGWQQAPAAEQNANWGQPNQAQDAAQSQASGSWGQSGSTESGWGAANPAATNQAAAQPAQGGWGQSPAPSTGWSQDSATAQQDASADKSKASWSIPAEQLETGSFKAWDDGKNPQENLGANNPGQQSATLDANRFDTPIQERGEAENQAQAVPGQSESQGNWDVPIQEKMQQAQEAPAAAQPAQAPQPDWTQGNAQAQAQTNLGDDVQSHWDLPIQEKLKQTAGDASAPAPAPAPAAPPAVPAPGAPSLELPAPGAQQQTQVPATPFGAPSPQAAPPQSAAGEQSSGLFGKPLDDSTIDQIFQTNLGVDEGQAATAPAAPPAPAPVPAAPAAPPAPVPEQVQNPGEQQMQLSDVAAMIKQAPEADNQAQPGGWGTPPAAPAAPETPPATGGWAVPTEAPQQQSGLSFEPPAVPAPPNQPPTPEAPQTPKISSVTAKNGGGESTDAANAGGIFNLDDAAVDQIFKGMGIPEDGSGGTQQDTGTPPAAPAAPPAPAPVPAAPPAPAPVPAAPPAPAPMQQAAAPPAAPAFGAPQAAPAPQGFGQAPQLEAPPPVPQAAPQPQAQPSGLFNIDDSDMDKMFDKVLAGPGGSSEAAQVGGQNMAPQPGAAPTSPAMPPAPPAPAGFGVAPPAQPMAAQAPVPQPPVPQAALPQAPVPQAAMPQPVQQLAQVVDSSSPPPKVEGIGKLDSAADSNDGGSGRIAAIGKFLLDQKDLERLGKITEADQGEVKMRILTMEASDDLQGLLKEIGSQEKVIGSVIVGHDGLLIANTMPEEVDAESIGVWALGVYMNTEHVTKKMGHDRVHQVVSRTPRGYVVIADFGGGLLVTITDGTETTTLIPLMRKITDLVS